MALAGAEVVYADQWKLITILCKNYLEIVKDHSCLVVPSCFAGEYPILGGIALDAIAGDASWNRNSPASWADGGAWITSDFGSWSALGSLRTTGVAGDSSAPVIDPS